MYSFSKTLVKSCTAGIGTAIANLTAFNITNSTENIEEQTIILITAIITALLTGLKNWIKNRKKKS